MEDVRSNSCADCRHARTAPEYFSLSEKDDRKLSMPRSQPREVPHDCHVCGVIFGVIVCGNEKYIRFRAAPPSTRTPPLNLNRALQKRWRVDVPLGEAVLDRDGWENVKRVVEVCVTPRRELIGYGATELARCAVLPNERECLGGGCLENRKM